MGFQTVPAIIREFGGFEDEVEDALGAVVSICDLGEGIDSAFR